MVVKNIKLKEIQNKIKILTSYRVGNFNIKDREY